MRRFLFLLTLTLCLPTTARLPAQVPDPGAIQDREAEREKLLKASDQLDNMQANSEATKVAVDGMKTNISGLEANVTQLQTDNAALKQQLADLQTAFDQYKADQTKERQALIDNVATMIAAGKSTKKKKDAPSVSADSSSAATPPSASATATAASSSGALAPPPDPSQPPTPPPAPKPQKGYYHVVASGETLTMICAAYRDNGVHVTAAQIRKANGLTEDSELKTGQKLFIPKPGT